MKNIVIIIYLLEIKRNTKFKDLICSVIKDTMVKTIVVLRYYNFLRKKIRLQPIYIHNHLEKILPSFLFSFSIFFSSPHGLLWKNEQHIILTKQVKMKYCSPYAGNTHCSQKRFSI